METKKFFGLVVVLVSVLVIGAGSLVVEAKTITIKATTFLPMRSSANISVKRLIKKINERAEGRLEIKLLGGPEVIPMFELAEAVRKGVVDMAFHAASIYDAQLPGALMWGLTRIKPWEERTSGFYELGVELHKKKMNVMYLGRIGTSTFHMGIDVEVKTPKEIAGKKIIARGQNAAFVKRLGATPVSVSHSEVYTALERGVANGWTTVMYSAAKSGYQEVSKYIIDHNFLNADMLSLVNLDVWTKIPKDLQNIFIDEAKNIEKWVEGFEKEETAKGRKTFEDAGVKFIKFSAEDAAWYQNTAFEVALKEAAKSAGTELVEKMKPMLGY